MKYNKDLLALQKSCYVYNEANAEHILGYLPKDIWFEFDGQDNGYAKIVKVHCNYIPSSLLVTDEAVSDGATETAPTHHGWVKLSELSSLKYRTKELDKVVVLDKPVAIKGGDFVGYLGYNVSRGDKFPQSEHFPLVMINYLY